MINKVNYLFKKTTMQTRNPVEVFLMLVAFWWGFVLVMPSDVFPHFPAGYSAMSNLASELVWGCFMLSVGLIISIGLSTRHSTIRKAGAILSSALWFFVGSMFIQANVVYDTFTVAGGLHVIFGLLSSWLFITLSSQERWR